MWPNWSGIEKSGEGFVVWRAFENAERVIDSTY
jgi:hypothetical protein